ncbi:TonB-dependent receptor domain-containing protein [Methylopila henanensis]|uniref:TonB-dependent receptor domain-containing protein n=1 Tax=Methylopila henanensis TaxID=873516 RepID=A0ABW4K3Q7_9HYPH
MKLLRRAALLWASAPLLATAASLAAAGAANAQTEAGATYTFDIPAKPLLSAFADYTRLTGVQILRPSAQRLTGRSRSVSGQLDADTALRRMLEGSGLVHSFSTPSAATLYPLNEPLAPVQLAGGATPLEEITVTGEGAEDAPSGAPGSFVVTASDIARKNPQDVKDLFGGEPGVQVGSSIPLSQKVYVRGIEETNLAVSIDGAAQNNKVFHHNATTYIDPGLLKQARVDPSVAPANAGFGALAGSIAYETKDVADLLGHDREGVGGVVKGTFNSNGGVFGTSVTGYGKQNGFEALGYLNWEKGGRYENGGDDKMRGTATDLLSGLGKLAYESAEGHRFEASYQRVLDDAIRPFRPNAGRVVRPLPDGATPEPPTRPFRLERQNAILHYSMISPEGWFDPKVVLAYGSTKVKVPTYPRDPDTGSFFYSYDSTGVTSTLNGRIENKFAFAFGSVTAGVDFRNDRADLRDRFDGADERMTNLGAYAQARLELFDRTRVSFGARGDRQWFRGSSDSDGAKKDHGGVSVNASGEYDLIADLLTAKAGYSHVWAGVPLAENFIINPAWDYAGGSGKDLNATTSDNYSAGLMVRRDGFTVEGSLFRTQIENARNAKFSNSYHPPYGEATVPGATWAPDLDTRGFELGVGYEWKTGFVRVKYAHIDVDIDGRRGDSDTGNYIATPVGDIITISAAHTFVDWNVTVGGDVEIAPTYRRTAINPETITPKKPRGDRYPAYPAYEIVNAFIEYRPRFKYETTLRLDVTNIFDENYSSRASYGSEFNNVTPLFEPGRAFLMTAQVKF